HRRRAALRTAAGRAARITATGAVAHTGGAAKWCAATPGAAADATAGLACAAGSAAGDRAGLAARGMHGATSHVASTTWRQAAGRDRRVGDTVRTLDVLAVTRRAGTIASLVGGGTRRGDGTHIAEIVAAPCGILAASTTRNRETEAHRRPAAAVRTRTELADERGQIGVHGRDQVCGVVGTGGVGAGPKVPQPPRPYSRARIRPEAAVPRHPLRAV